MKFNMNRNKVVNIKGVLNLSSHTYTLLHLVPAVNPYIVVYTVTHLLHISSSVIYVISHQSITLNLFYPFAYLWLYAEFKSLTEK